MYYSSDYGGSYNDKFVMSQYGPPPPIHEEADTDDQADATTGTMPLSSEYSYSESFGNNQAPVVHFPYFQKPKKQTPWSSGLCDCSADYRNCWHGNVERQTPGVEMSALPVMATTAPAPAPPSVEQGMSR
ncbi:hypothetical protein ACFE04_003082 [Oxalis oulophora]